MNHQIAAAAEQQSTVAEQISRGIVTVSESAEQSAAAFRNAQQESEGQRTYQRDIAKNISRSALGLGSSCSSVLKVAPLNMEDLRFVRKIFLKPIMNSRWSSSPQSPACWSPSDCLTIRLNISGLSDALREQMAAVTFGAAEQRSDLGKCTSERFNPFFANEGEQERFHKSWRASKLT